MEENYTEYGYTGNLYEQMEAGLCKKCRKRSIDRSENPESVLCKECREELIKLKVPPVIIGISVIVAVIVLICMGIFTYDLIRYKTGTDVSQAWEEDYEEDDEIFDSDEDEEEYEYNRTQSQSPVGLSYSAMADTGMVITAMDSMVEELENDPDNLELAITLTDVAMKYSYPDYAAYAIENYLVDETVSDEEYDRINGYIDELNLYYDTADKLDEIWNDILGEEEGNEDIDVEVVLSAYHDEISVMLSNDDYDQALLYYDLAYVCQDEEERIEHLKDCVSIDPNYFDAQAQLCVHYRRQGDLETAREIIEEVYLTNAEDYSVLRALATLELAEGNLEQGLTYAKEAYEIYPDGDYVIDTYLVALMANGQQEEAEELTRQYEDEGYIFDDDFYDFQMGDMTLEEYYIGE